MLEQKNQSINIFNIFRLSLIACATIIFFLYGIGWAKTFGPLYSFHCISHYLPDPLFLWVCTLVVTLTFITIGYVSFKSAQAIDHVFCIVLLRRPRLGLTGENR